MTRRLAGVLAVCFALFALGTSSAQAEVGDGPELAGFSLTFKPLKVTLLSINPLDRSNEALLARGFGRTPVPELGSIPIWSPDGSTLALEAAVGTKRSVHGTRPRTQLFLVNADGSGLRSIPGTEEGSDPVFSPDGQTFAFAKTRERWVPNQVGGEEAAYRSRSIWLVDLSGGQPRQLTPWKDELFYAPSSFAPDGQVLAATRTVGDGVGDAVALPLIGGPPAVLARDGLDPTYSPDGSKIAYLSGRSFSMRSRSGGRVTGIFTDVRVMNSDGSDSVRLTNTPKLAEVGLGWDPSGSRLAFTRLPDPSTEAGFLGLGDSIIQMNADGTCQQTVLSNPRAVYIGASWRPGPGRGVGPIAC